MARASALPPGLSGPTKLLINGEWLEPESGRHYDFVVTGTFVYNASGAQSDGVDLWVDGVRMASVTSPDHRYCLRVSGPGAPAQLLIRDASHGDNSGALAVSIYRAD